MSVRGVVTGMEVECTKLFAQLRVHLVLVVCAIAPFLFAATMRLQSSMPTDTLFGRAVTESGFALSLVVLGFGGLWAFPALASLVAGDLFSSEDRHGTWKTVLTRSQPRADVFAGKVSTALLFSSCAVAILGASSLAAGALVIGPQPLIDLSGQLLSPVQALVRVGLAWLSVLPPTFAFTALAVLLSVATRSSATGIGLPVVIGLTLQLYALVDGPEALRLVLMTSAFDAWHGLLAAPTYYRPLLHSAAMSAMSRTSELRARWRRRSPTSCTSRLPGWGFHPSTPPSWLQKRRAGSPREAADPATGSARWSGRVPSVRCCATPTISSSRPTGVIPPRRWETISEAPLSKREAARW